MRETASARASAILARLLIVSERARARTPCSRSAAGNGSGARGGGNVERWSFDTSGLLCRRVSARSALSRSDEEQRQVTTL